jgi:hypothetical protein
LLSRKLRALFRALALLWGRLGAARIYVGIALGIIGLLAFLGAWQIVSWAKQVALSVVTQPAITAAQPANGTKTPDTSLPPKTDPPVQKSPVVALSPTAPPSSPSVTTTPARPSPNELEREVEITNITQTRRRGRRGETFVVAKIGLASRSDLEKGDVEIRITFYDLTPTNEIVPTDAQVTYQWLTPVRDWSDPTPKYLAATYLQWPMRHSFFERLRYGGVVVRVYDRGRLQDQRSEPERLLSLLRSNGSEEPDSDADVSAAPRTSRSPGEEKSEATLNSTKPQASPSEKKGNSSTSPALPYGKPVPGKPGFVSSPYDPKFIIDVRGFPPGTLVNDPNTNKPFRVP